MKKLDAGAVCREMKLLRLISILAAVLAGCAEPHLPIRFEGMPKARASTILQHIKAIGPHQLVPVIFSEADLPEGKSGIARVSWIEDCKVTIDSLIGDDLLLPVVWHEYGHCAGLHHVEDSEAVMYRYVRPARLYLDSKLQDFKDTILRLRPLR